MGWTIRLMNPEPSNYLVDGSLFVTYWHLVNYNVLQILVSYKIAYGKDRQLSQLKQ